MYLYAMLLRCTFDDAACIKCLEEDQFYIYWFMIMNHDLIKILPRNEMIIIIKHSSSFSFKIFQMDQLFLSIIPNL